MSDVVSDVTVEAPAVPQDITGEQAKAMVEAEKAAKASAGVEDATKEAAREAIRKHRFKVAGEEVEVDDDELKRGYGHQKAANKILQEGKAALKQAQEFITMMKDPAKFYEVAQKLGHDPRDLSEKYLVRQLEDEMLDPKEKENRTLKAQLKAIEDEKLSIKQAEEASRNEALKAKYTKDYSDQFVSALQETGLPPTKMMVAEMAKYIGRAADLKFKMTASEAATLVKEDLQNSISRLVGETDGETLLRIIGEDAANKIRKYDVGKLKNPERLLKTPSQQAAPRQRQNPNKRMTPMEWRKFNRGG